MKNSKLFLVLAMLGNVALNANAHPNTPQCDLSLPGTISIVKYTVLGQGYCSAEPNQANAMVACTDKMNQLVQADVSLAGKLSCGGARVTIRYNNSCLGNGSTENLVEIDVIENTPVPSEQALQMKCDKLNACFLAANDLTYATQLRADLQTLQCK